MLQSEVMARFEVAKTSTKAVHSMILSFQFYSEILFRDIMQTYFYLCEIYNIYHMYGKKAIKIANHMEV